MKKIILALAILSSPFSLSALPLANPIEASLYPDGVFCPANPYNQYTSIRYAWSVRVGFYGDYVFNRHLKIDRNEDSSVIRNTEIYTNAGYVAINFWDTFDLFGILGSTHIKLETPRSAFAISTAGNNIEAIVETETDYCWSIGGRVTLLECRWVSFGLETQYFYTRPDINYIKNTLTTSPIYPENEHFKYREWQIGAGISSNIEIVSCTASVVPYLGIKYSQVQVNMDDLRVTDTDMTVVTNQYYNLKNSRDWGYVIGLSVIGCHKWGATIEGRFADEKALYFNTQFRF